MAAILRSILTSIENDRIRLFINQWKNKTDNDIHTIIKKRFTPADAIFVQQLIEIITDPYKKELSICTEEYNKLYWKDKDVSRRIMNATQSLQNQLDSEKKNVQLLSERCLKGEQKISELTAELEQMKKKYQN